MMQNKNLFVTPFLIFLLFPLQNAEARDVPRAALMEIAHDFVNRIGQKMQGDSIIDSKLYQIPEGELLILQPRISNKILVDATIGAIRKKKKIFISFREFCQGMNFPLTVHPETLQAQGWFIKETNNFTLDLNQGFVQSKGQRYTVNADEWFRQDGEIYITTDSIATWMDIESRLVSDSLLLELVSADPFPLEQKIARKERKLTSTKFETEPTLPPIEQPYELFKAPAVDVTLNNSITKIDGRDPQSTLTQSITTAGDFLGLTTRTFTTLNRDTGINSIRFTAGKTSEYPDMLGRLQAREFMFGDILPTELPGTGGTDREIGFRVTNSKENLIAGSTQRTFAGDLPPDWDVELYDGAQLIAFQTVGPDGRYRFSNVDLFAGENDFRLVFYGPQGEVREEEVSIPVNLEDIGTDNKLYDISMSLNNIQTYNLVPNESVDQGTPHLVVSYEQGIRDGLTLNGGVRIRQTNEKMKVIGQTGVITRLGKTLLNMNLITDEELEASFETVARRNFGEHDLRIGSFYATSKFDPTNSGGEPNSFRQDLSLRGPIAKLGSHKISYGLDANYSEKAKNDNNMNVKFSQSTRWGRFNLGHALDFNRSYSEGEQFQSLSSSFNIRSSIGTTRLRASAIYNYMPESQWTGLILNVNRYLLKNLQAEMEIKQELTPNKTEATAQLNWRNDHFVLSPRVTYDSDHDVRASLNMRFGLTYDEFNHSFDMTRDQVTNKGAVHAFVYLDRDGNNKFDGKDEPIPDAKVMSIQVSRHKMTNEKGEALLNDLPEFEPTDIILDQASLGDPYYVSGFEGLSIFPRPGAMVKLEFPVHISGEMDGTVYKPGVIKPEPASGLRLQLFNHKGENIMSSLSAFDGYYVISVIPPGDYLLMVNPDDLRGSGYRQPWPKKITIGYDGKVLSGQDIYLEKGTEVALNFPAVEKIKRNKLNVQKHEDSSIPVSQIEVQMGQYKSSLLAQVVKLRINKLVRESGLTIPLIHFRTEIAKEQPVQQLFTTLPTTAIDDARSICAILSSRHLTCTLTVPPAILMETKQATVIPPALAINQAGS